MPDKSSLEMLHSLEQLLDTWEYWEQLADEYLGTVLPNLQRNPSSGTPKEQRLIRDIQECATAQEWADLPSIAANIPGYRHRVNDLIANIGRKLAENDFVSARTLAATSHDSFTEFAYRDACREARANALAAIQSFQEAGEFERAKAVLNANAPLWTEIEARDLEAERQQREQAYIERSIEAALKAGDCLRARRLVGAFANQLSRPDFESRLEECEREQAKRLALQELRHALEQFDFLGADRIWQRNGIPAKLEYEQQKAGYLLRYLQTFHGVAIHPEKAFALAKSSPRLLVAARAGSGKSTLLAIKALMIAEQEKIAPSKILVLAFNKRAANEIKATIRDKYQVAVDNVRTFHSLAYQLVQPEERVVADDGGISEVVRQAFTDILDEQTRAELYQVFRREMLEFERSGASLSEADYYVFARNLRQITLDGHRVKSRGEKYIADFLFEYGIHYSYEKPYRWDGRLYRPDFTIWSGAACYIVEHWGIDLSDPADDVPRHWNKTRAEYVAEAEEKRAYWRTRKITLLETSTADLRAGRAAFEAKLYQLLSSVGIPCVRVPQSQLEQMVSQQHHDHLTKLFEQFIQRVKKKRWSPADAADMFKLQAIQDERTRLFVDVALRVYEAYEKRLRREYLIDFDDLVFRAAERIHSTSGTCPLPLAKATSRPVMVRDLQWVLVDEFQDFSELFYQMITAIMSHAPEARILCVGDDWQAINSFAGSDLRFYHDFVTLFGPAETVSLATNFRSRREIVEMGNRLMAGLGTPGQALPDSQAGEVRLDHVDKVWVEVRPDEVYAAEREEDSRFTFVSDGSESAVKSAPKLMVARYLKACYKIALRPENAGKTLAILARTNFVEGVTLDRFGSQFLKCFTEQDKQVSGDIEDRVGWGTVHSYKGLQADVVIVLGVCQGQFPMLHPDNELFLPLGVTAQSVLDEERRLFYVAITRAVERLYLLTEYGRESDYLDALFGRQRSQNAS